MDGEAQVGEIWLAYEGGYERCEEIFGQGGDYSSEGGADYYAYGHVDYVAAQDELFEAG